MVEFEQFPHHLVLIPDGNGRWAQRHRLPMLEGHIRGAKAIRNVLYELESLPIDVVTIWGFSSENWTRSQEEVTGIMTVMSELVDIEGDRLVDKGYRFKHVGRKDRIPQELLIKLSGIEERSLNNLGKTLCLALDYGGRDEIVRAVNKTQGQRVNEENFKDFLDTAGLPDPDLIIRTSGEMRTSGIYPYQGVYTEFVSSQVLLPDFDKKELLRCLEEYSKRQRRFGARLEQSKETAFSWLDLPDTSFDSYMEAILPELNRVVDKFTAKWREGKFYKDSPALQKDIDIYRILLTGGKKLRPALLMLGYENYQGEKEFREGVLEAAIGYEVIHNSFLIHDDIEDNSLLRRGQPAVHDQYRISHEQTGGVLDSRQYGIAAAINTGDIGPFHALGMIWDIENRSNRIVKAQQWLRYVIETTLQGQRRDLTEIPLALLDNKYVYQIYHQKTAVYTVVGPLTLGAILAGASERDLRYLNTFGVNLGIAFQMIDDHLGMFGDEQVLGKPVDSDIKEAKKTLHFVRSYKTASASEREFLQNMWGKRDINTEELEQVREFITRLGVKDFVLDKADQLAAKARSVIPKITNDQTIGNILEGLTEFVVARNF